MNHDLLRRARRVIRDTERGVSAVILAISMTVMMGAAAIGFDIAQLYYAKQMVRNAVDAAAQVGAAQLPTDGTATYRNNLSSAIQQMASLNYSDIAASGPNAVVVKFLCVVSNTSGTASVASPNLAQIPYTCNPGSPGTGYDSASVKCSASSCAIPCDDATDICNAVQVSYTKKVAFVFAPAINIPYGTTGAVTTVSCRGTCGGQAAPNPMNVVVMADRTPSMSSSQLDGMKTGISGMLAAMNQSQQYVAFGALGISATSTSTNGKTLITAASTSGAAFKESDYASYPADKKGVAQPTTWSSQNKLWHFNGTWVPIKYTNNYQTTSSGKTVMNTSSQLGQAVSGLAASGAAGTYPSPWHISSSGGSVSTSNRNLKAYDEYGQSMNNYGNTHLASALKAAVRYVMNTNPASMGLPDRSALGTVKNVVIFETDGAPREIFNSGSTALSLSNDYDVGATDDTTPTNTVQQACDNFTSVATDAKKAKGANGEGLTLIMIAVGDAAQSATTCGSTSVAKMMASAASPKADGTPSDAAASCDTAQNRLNENADGDNFYCAADATELKSVFTAALGNIVGGTRFLAIDGVSD